MSNFSAGTGSMPPVPVIDERNREQLIEQFRRMAPFYAPEWKFRPDDPDPGTALALIFIHLLEGNIRRLNQVPYKSFLAFLNGIRTELAPARPALAQVTFRLAEGTPEPVLVEKGTRLAAEIPGETEPVLFETAHPVLITTARLTDLVSVSPRRDRIVRLADAESGLVLHNEGKGTAIFGLEGRNLQEHAMYVRHDELFLLRHPAIVELTFANTPNEQAVFESVQLLADEKRVCWEYFSGGEWVAFDRVYGRRSTIRLVKLYPRPIEPTECDGIGGYWIRCRAGSLDAQTGANKLARVQFDRVQIKSEFAAATDDDGIVPDLAFFNDARVDADEGCLPFGDFFAPYGMFYIASEESFSKKGARVTLRFNLEFVPHRLLPERPPQINWKMIMKRHELEKVDIPDPVTVASVQWEYWNGSSWAILPVGAEARELFAAPWEGRRPVEISFDCPRDMAPILVNAEENYWIRCRIVQVRNAFSPNAVYFSPFVGGTRIRFSSDRPLDAPQSLLTENHLERQDRTGEARFGGFSIRPFQTLEGSSPALWLGFDAPPERGPISIYLNVKPRPVAEDDVPFIEWEYLKQVGGSAVWAPLSVADDTNGFTRSGDIRFAGPRDFALRRHFGAERYWIRAVNRDRRYDMEEEQENVPRVLDMLMNTALAVQQKTIRNEFPLRMETYDTADERTSEYYQLAEIPVLSEEVWVDETDELDAEGHRSLVQGEDVEYIRDSDGQIMRAWVRYRAVPHFLRSGPGDRHYVIDRATGRIYFGDGTAGRRPSRDREDAVRVTYAAGGGKRGNVPAGTITSMQDAIAFIDSVTNLLPAAGGCDTGTVEEAIVRGPKRLNHFHRAVTAEDFEWLAREIHPNVAKVKCLPNMNAKLEKQPGAVTVVVLPESGLAGGAHFRELKRAIEEGLLARAAANIAFPGSIQVIEPALMETGVLATVWVKNMDDVVPVEREILRKLEQFLDPIHGNVDGRGWEIGQVVHPSMFFSLLKSVGPVVHIPRLSLEICKLEHGDRTEINPERMGDFPHGIVVPGKHRIIVEMKR